MAWIPIAPNNYLQTKDLKGDRQESNFLFCITEIFNLNKNSTKKISLIDEF